MQRIYLPEVDRLIKYLKLLKTIVAVNYLDGSELSGVNRRFYLNVPMSDMMQHFSGMLQVLLLMLSYVKLNDLNLFFRTCFIH